MRAIWRPSLVRQAHQAGLECNDASCFSPPDVGLEGVQVRVGGGSGVALQCGGGPGNEDAGLSSDSVGDLSAFGQPGEEAGGLQRADEQSTTSQCLLVVDPGRSYLAVGELGTSDGGTFGCAHAGEPEVGRVVGQPRRVRFPTVEDVAACLSRDGTAG